MTTNVGRRFIRRSGREAPAAPAADDRAKPPADLFDSRQRLVEAGLRFTLLRQAAAGDAEGALLELDVALEELRLADEELRAQREELDRAAKSIASERLRYRELFDFAPDPYLVTDQSGKVLAANRASAGLFNAPPHKLPGRCLISFVPLGEREAFRERLAAAVRSDRPLRWEATLNPPGHREPPPEIAVAITAAPALSGSLLWTFRDVTEQRRQEAKTRALNEGLERVVERTCELEASCRALEEMLTREREARRQAERATRERDELLALAPHELCSPLHAIVGWVSLAADSDEYDSLRPAPRAAERDGRALAPPVSSTTRPTRAPLVAPLEGCGRSSPPGSSPPSPRSSNSAARAVERRAPPIARFGGTAGPALHRSSAYSTRLMRRRRCGARAWQFCPTRLVHSHFGFLPERS